MWATQHRDTVTRVPRPPYGGPLLIAAACSSLPRSSFSLGARRGARSLPRRLAVGEHAAVAWGAPGAVRFRDLPPGRRGVPPWRQPLSRPRCRDRRRSAAVRLSAGAGAPPDSADGSSRIRSPAAPRPASSSPSFSSRASSGRCSPSTSRDWRCYPVALLYPPRSRTSSTEPSGRCSHCSSRSAGATATSSCRGDLGAAVVLKVFLWPLARLAGRDAPMEGGGRGGSASPWSRARLLGRDRLSRPRRLPGACFGSSSDLEAENSYSAFAILRGRRLCPELVAQVVVAALRGRPARSRRGAQREATCDVGERDRRSLTLMLAAGFVLTPILWLHYLVLLVVPIALARPRLSALWLVPLALTVFEALDWYRGWPRGDGEALASVALVVTPCSWSRVSWPSFGGGRNSPARLVVTWTSRSTTRPPWL